MTSYAISYTQGTPATHASITVRRGEDLSLVVTMLDSSGAARDCSGGTVTLYIRPNGDTGGAISFPVTGTVSGVHTITIQSDDTQWMFGTWLSDVWYEEDNEPELVLLKTTIQASVAVGPLGANVSAAAYTDQEVAAALVEAKEYADDAVDAITPSSIGAATAAQGALADTALQANQTVMLSGDATGSGATSIAVTLANSGVTAGAYGSASSVPVVTVDAKGRVTGVSTSSIAIEQSAVSGLSTALGLKADLVDGTVPTAQLPSAALLALGETSSTAYRGDRGKTAYDHSQVTSGNPHAVTASDVGLGNCNNTSDANKPVSTATSTAITAQTFAAVALTNPHTSSISPRRIGDLAVNTTSNEIWQATSATAAASSWTQVASETATDTAVLATAFAGYDYGNAASCRISTVTGHSPYVGDWSKSGWGTAFTTSTGDGQYGAYGAPESSTTSRYFQFIATNTLTSGWCRVKFQYRPGVEYKARRYAFYPNAYAEQFVYLPSIEQLRYPDSEADYTLYKSVSTYHADGFSFKEKIGGWIEVEFESVLAGTSASYGTKTCVISTRSGSYAPLTSAAITVGQVVVEQDKVSHVAPVVGNGDCVLVQSTAMTQPVLASRYWYGGSALVEGCGNSCRLTGSCALGANWTRSAVVWIKWLRPTSIVTLLELTGTTASVKLQIDTTGKWLLSRTDDSGATLTSLSSTYVAPVPVCVTLTASATELTLCVDGDSVATLSYTSTATITGLALFSGDTVSAQSVIRNDYVWDSVLSSADLASAVSAQRNLARLPELWPVDYFSGQSNATSLGSGKKLYMSGLLSRPGVCYFNSDYGYENTGNVFGVGFSDAYSLNVGGHRVGWQELALADNEHGIAVSSAKGGTAIADWLSGGTMYTFMRTQFARAQSVFGTSKTYNRSFVFIQGEQDCESTASSYLTNLRTLRSDIRTLLGANLPFVIFGLNDWLGTQSDWPNQPVVRAAQETAAQDDDRTFIASFDGENRLQSNVHYPMISKREIGRRLWRAFKRRPQLVEVFNEDYPGRGLWSANYGGYWDASHGVTTALGTVSTWVSREGGLTLTATGSPTNAKTFSSGDSPAINFASSADYLSLVDATLFGNYSGSKTPSILVIQFETPASGSCGNIVTLGNSDGTVIQAGLSGTSSTVLTGTHTDATTPITTTYTIATGTVYTVALIHDGTSLSIVSDAPGVTFVTDSSSVSLTIDRIVLNALATSGGGANSIRRFGFMKATSSNARELGTKLWTMMRGLS